MDKVVSIILSTYNEATIIEETIKEINENLNNPEVVLVDDDSTDGTYEKVLKIDNKQLKSFSRKSRGLASAFLLGLINSSGEIVGWMDSNMPLLARKFPLMISELEKNDIVVLSRYVDGGKDIRSKTRILSSVIINKVCRFILSNKIKDYTSGIFLMKRNVLEKVVPICYGHGEFFIEFLYKAHLKGLKIKELPYTHPPDIEKMSKTAPNLIRFFSLGLDYVIRILLIRFRKN